MSNLVLLWHKDFASWHEGKQIIPITSVAAFYIPEDTSNFSPGFLSFGFSDAS